MSRSNSSLAFGAAIGLILLSVPPAKADDSTGDAVPNAPIPFRVSLGRGEIVASEQVQRVSVDTGTNQLMLVIPRGLRMESPTPEKIVIVPKDYGYFLTFRIINHSSGVTTAPGLDAYRKLLNDRYPGASVQEESSVTACGRTGPSVDLNWSTPGAATRLVRVAFIPSAVGVLEVSLITSAEKSADARYNFNVFLLSIRTNENGPIEINRFSDAS